MAKFCKYCGSPIPEGGSCECQKAKEERDPNVTNQESMQGNQSQQFAQTDMSPAAKIFYDTKNLIVNFFRKPVTTMEVGLLALDKTSQFMVGVLYAIILFLSLTMRLSGAIKYAFIIVLAFVAVKAIYAGLLYLFTKKQGSDFKSLFALYCLSSLPESVCIIIIFLLSYIAASAYIGLIIMAIMLFIVAIISEMTAVEIVLKKDRDKGFWLFLLFSFIIAIMEAFVIKVAVMAAIQSAVQSMGGLLGSFL